MNRVQTVTQKQYRVEKRGRKPSQVHKTPKLAQLGTPGAPRVHQWLYRGSLARPCRGQGRSYRGRDPAVSWSRPWPCRSAATLQRPARPSAPAPRAPQRSSAPRAPAPQCLSPSYRGLPMAVSWPGHPAVSRYNLASYPSALVTILQSVLQPNSHPIQAQAVAIQSLYRDTCSLPTQPATHLKPCNTNPAYCNILCPAASLQYNSCISIPPGHYTLYCNTICLQPPVCHNTISLCFKPSLAI